MLGLCPALLFLNRLEQLLIAFEVDERTSGHLVHKIALQAGVARGRPGSVKASLLAPAAAQHSMSQRWERKNGLGSCACDRLAKENLVFPLAMRKPGAQTSRL